MSGLPTSPVFHRCCRRRRCCCRRRCCRRRRDLFICPSPAPHRCPSSRRRPNHRRYRPCPLISVAAPALPQVNSIPRCSFPRLRSQKPQRQRSMLSSSATSPATRSSTSTTCSPSPASSHAPPSSGATATSSRLAAHRTRVGITPRSC
jgi:hypothetical protein